MQKYLPKSIFKKYVEDTILYLVSSQYFVKVFGTTLVFNDIFSGGTEQSFGCVCLSLCVWTMTYELNDL